MNVLFIKEKESTVDELLDRILCFLASYTKNTGVMPDYLKISKKDFNRIAEHRSNVIHDNNILGMEIITYEETNRPHKRYNPKYRKRRYE